MTRLRAHTLKTRVVAGTLGLLLAVVLVLGALVYVITRAHLRALVVQQQESTVALLVELIDQTVRERLTVLSHQAQALGPGQLKASPQALGLQLRALNPDRRLFTGGVLVLNPQGHVLAVDEPSHRLPNDLDLVSVRRVLQTGQAAVGQAFITPKPQARVLLGLAAPIKNTAGQVVAVLLGLTRLDEANFLDPVSARGYGLGGGFLIADPQLRRIIVSSERNRLMELLPAPGLSPTLDRLLTGEATSVEFTNPAGVHVLSSDRGVPSTGWVAAAYLPVSEAFAPIAATLRAVLLGMAALGALAAVLSWLWLRRALRPLERTVALLRDPQRQVADLRAALPEGELGELVSAFASLIDRLNLREADLRHTSHMLERTEAMAHIGSWSWRLTDDVLSWSPELYAIFQRDPALGPLDMQALTSAFTAQDHARVMNVMRSALRGLEPPDLKLAVQRPDGSTRTCVLRVRATPNPDDQVARLFGSLQDVSEDAQIQLALERAWMIFQHAREGILITDAQERILDNNPAFSRITGYGRAELRQCTPRLLKSGRHDAAFFAEMWGTLTEQGHWSGDIWNRRKDGSEFPASVHIAAVRDPNGQTTHYVGLMTDITARKALEDQVRELAFVDALTGLPNRRLLIERVSQALRLTRRHTSCGALMFIDLDNFKPLNDTHGHALGDLLLVEVAHRLRAQVRETDTVARLGGDEFVVLLPELPPADPRALALAVAEKLRAALSEVYGLTNAQGQPVLHHCSASVGLCLFDTHDSDTDRVLERADAAMYAAKLAGRNRVACSAGEAPASPDPKTKPEPQPDPATASSPAPAAGP